MAKETEMKAQAKEAAATSHEDRLFKLEQTVAELADKLTKLALNIKRTVLIVTGEEIKL